MRLQDDQSMEIQMLKRAYAVTLQGGQRLSVKLISFPPDHMVTYRWTFTEIEGKHNQELGDLKRKHQRGKETIEVHDEPPSPLSFV